MSAATGRVGVLAVATFAVGTDAYVVAGVLPELARSFAVDLARSGQLVTVFAVTYAVLAPVLTTLTGLWDRRRVLLTAVATFIVGNVWTASSSTFAMALVSRVAAAAGAAMVTPTCVVVASSLVPAERRVRAIAVVTSGLTVALALGSPLGTALGAATNWRATMVFIAVLGVVALLLVAATIPTMPAPSRVPLRRRLAPARDPHVLALVSSSLLIMAGVNVVYTYSSAVFEEATGGDSRLLALLIVVFGCAATGANLFVGHLAEIVRPRAVVATACVVLVVTLLSIVAGAATTIGGAIAVVAVYGGAAFSINAPQQHRLMTHRPEEAALVVALNATFVYLGITAAGGLGGLILDAAGATWLAPAAAGSVLLGLATSELHRPRSYPVSAARTSPHWKRTEDTAPPSSTKADPK